MIRIRCILKLSRLVYTIILSLLLTTAANSLAQPTFRGTIIDATSGEVLIGATLYDPSTGRGYTTNSYGFFTIPSVSDSISLTVSYMGYETRVVGIAPSQSTIKIQLTPGTTELEEVVVRGIGNRTPTHGQHTISRVDLRNTPVLMAEKDVLKTIQLLPGIQQNSEGTSNFSVRGGSHDQNLMLIDGIPVYNINHLWGFVSVFNTDAVNNVNFYKGGIPASYGGRLSSVVDVMLREGNPEIEVFVQIIAGGRPDDDRFTAEQLVGHIRAIEDLVRAVRIYGGSPELLGEVIDLLRPPAVPDAP